MGVEAMRCGVWDRPARDRARLRQTQHLPLYRAVRTDLGSLSGVRLLDVACGIGLALREAGARGALVSGVDAAAGLLEIARWALPDADLRVGIPDAIPFGDNRFDVVLASDAMPYAEDLPVAVAELVRVVRPGGRIAIGTWETRSPFDRLHVLDPREATRMSQVDDLLRGHGLTSTTSGALDCPVVYQDIAAAWAAVVDTDLIASAIDTFGEDTVHTAFLDAAAPVTRADGSVRQDNTFGYLIATRNQA